MSRPSFLEGAGVALVSSIVGGGVMILLLPLFSGALLLAGIAAAIGLGYLLYLLRRTRARVGKVSMLALWAAVTAVTFAVDPPLVLHAVAQLTVVWIARSLFIHDSVLAALADLAVCAASLAAAAWAAHHTGSLALTLWCLMLVQAAFVAIPGTARGTSRGAAMAPRDDDPFQRAHRAAEAALRRLSTVR